MASFATKDGSRPFEPGTVKAGLFSQDFTVEVPSNERSLNRAFNAPLWITNRPIEIATLLEISRGFEMIVD